MNWKMAGMLLLASTLGLPGADEFASDVFPGPGGELRITFIGHASLRLQYGQWTIYVDPDGRLADFAAMPKADLILVTHHHGDHFDPKALAALRQPTTRLIASALCRHDFADSRVMGNGERTDFAGIAIEAVPAYNVEHKRPDGRPFHPRGEGNGYVISFPGRRVYIAGDTENIPEMAMLKGIDIAFLPMNLPYTMTPQMTALAARTIRPRVLYPYHFSDTDPQLLVRLLGDCPDIEVRVRKLH